MSVLTGRIFAGHLRSIIGSMTVEEIVTERQKLATEVLDGSKAEMAKIGLTVDSLQIQSIDDMDAGYIDGDGGAAQRRDPAAGPDRPGPGQPGGRRGRSRSPQRNQAEYARQTAIVQAQYKAEVDQAQAEAAQAGPLAQAQAQREVHRRADRAGPARRPSCASSSWSPRSSSPAEAEAERIRILAKADAERMRIQAEAAASHNRVALDRMLIDQLPQIVREAAGGLAGANVNVLNGADGLGEIAAGWSARGSASSSRSRVAWASTTRTRMKTDTTTGPRRLRRSWVAAPRLRRRRTMRRSTRSQGRARAPPPTRPTPAAPQ